MSISQAVTPLRWIFWGGLLCVFDFSVSSSTSVNGRVQSGFRFDILNDFAGMLLITAAVSRLAKFAVDPSYRSSMQFVFFCSILNCVKALAGHIIFPPNPLLSVLSNLVGIASLVAMVLFCTSMHALALTHELHESASSWTKTRLLVIVLWVIPLGLLNLAGLGAVATGKSVHFNIGVLVIPLLAAFAVPLIHLFKSTSRMRLEAERVQFGSSPGL